MLNCCVVAAIGMLAASNLFVVLHLNLFVVPHPVLFAVQLRNLSVAPLPWWFASRFAAQRRVLSAAQHPQ